MRSLHPVADVDDQGLELLASAGQPWVAVSLDGVIVGWNRWAEQLFGWSHTEAVGRPLSEFQVHVDDPVVARALRAMPENPSALTGRKVQASVQHRDGYQLRIELTVAMRQEAGVPVYHAFAYDVTEARRVERFVKAQRAVSEALMAQSPAEDVLPGVVQVLARHLSAEIGVVWTGDETSTPARIFGPPAPVEEEHALIARMAPDPVDEALSRRRAVSRRADLVDGSCQSGVWIPVWAGPHIWGVIQLVTSTGHLVGSLALDVLTSTGAQIGFAVHQRRAEEQLRAAGEQNRRILETSTEGIIGLDSDGRVTFANRAAGRAISGSPESLIGRLFDDLMPVGPGADAAGCALTEAVRKGRALPSGDARFRLDETDIVVEYACSPMDDEHGGAVVTFRDVTGRRELEAARERDLDFLQTLLDSLEEGVLACDANGELTLFNRAMREVLGRDVEPIRPPAWPSTFGLRDPESLEPLRFEDLPLYRALQGEQVSNACVLVRRADCKERLLNVNARPLVDADGRRLGAVATVRDMTAHQQVLARMDEAERIAGVGVWEYDLTTRDVFWSQGIYRIVGLEPGSAVPGDEVWRERMHPDDVEDAYRRVDEMTRSDAQSWEQRYRIYRTDGSLRWVHSHSEKVVDADGAVRRLRGTMQDYTDRAEAEAALRRSEARARQRDRMDSLGQLAGGIAHDFNNLLAVMLSYSEFALDDLPAGTSTRADVEEIRRAAERAADLTQRLLVFSRGEAVRAQLIDLGKLMQDLEPMLRRTLGEQLDIVIDVKPGLGPVSADATQLEQVLVNLALNARDAMPGGGRLEICVSAAEVRDHDDDNLAPGRYVQIEVTDTGVGMPPEVSAHVFEPFFTTKAKGRGTGLGLATVYGIVSEAGGSIGVRSAPGEGSTFTVNLPMVAGQDAAAGTGARSAAPRPVHSARILVVEDDAMVRAATVRILERGGHEVISADNADAALDALEVTDGAIDMLVTDVVMPGRSGWELHEEVCRRWPGVRTVFMSGHTDEIVGRDALSGEGIEFIAKPFVGDDLLAKVAAQLRI